MPSAETLLGSGTSMCPAAGKGAPAARTCVDWSYHHMQLERDLQGGRAGKGQGADKLDGPAGGALPQHSLVALSTVQRRSRMPPTTLKGQPLRATPWRR